MKSKPSFIIVGGGMRPSYFFTDQYDFSMEHTGDIARPGTTGSSSADTPIQSDDRLLAAPATCPGWHEHQHLGCR